MSRQQDRERLEQAIKDAEARLRVFRTTLEGISKELRDLRAVEIILTDNIETLKSKTVIILANEYRKAREDLGKTKSRMAIVRIDYDNVFKAAHEVELYLAKAKEEMSNSLRDPNNVLIFRRKNAKE